MIDDTESGRDAEIIEARVAGKSVRAIAKAHGISAAEVNKVIDRFADNVITDKIRKHSLALELERLDEVQEVFYQRALGGDVQCGLLILKLIERRGVMLGLHAPQRAVLQIVDEAAPKETSTDRIERALNLLREQRLLEQKKSDEPTAH
jgi:transposase